MPAALAALLLVAAGACAAPAGPLPAAGGPVRSVFLTATLTRTPTALSWDYVLRNDEPTELAVFNGDPADDNPLAESPSPQAWVVPRDGTTVEVAQRLFAAPPTGGPHRSYLQYGTVLPPGATLSGRVTVPYPLTLTHPYGTAFDPPLRLPDVRERVVFCIGVARPADVPAAARPSGGPADPSAVPGARTQVYAHGADVPQHLVCAPPERLP
ncbi:hypothetical protein [Spirilliplanes yamanashiensis]|uniref:Secreted protein n=1 Tax=Spirilliplanes yamanashiensis TaxID=42233 RepID=A0A8J3YD12_9ACTN|nr:hypothetical protein [Spirilliplanes yamanashiensis]MDP9816094.1 hypothetical protein [Spirilliplanes yamanashiensis]GIJ05617.1 hypothetical protein Sya03_49690 [Spirilliplanes yamanashiensis]